MPDGKLEEAEIDAIADQMRTLGHATRLKLVEALLDGGEMAVGELDGRTGVGQPALSQQLAILRKAGLVHTRREAKQVYYSVAPGGAMLAATFLARMTGAGRGVVAEGNGGGEAGAASARPRGSAAMFARILEGGRGA